jgi:hypothetical protein
MTQSLVASHLSSCSCFRTRAAPVLFQHSYHHAHSNLQQTRQCNPHTCRSSCSCCSHSCCSWSSFDTASSASVHLLLRHSCKRSSALHAQHTKSGKVASVINTSRLRHHNRSHDSCSCTECSIGEQCSDASMGGSDSSQSGYLSTHSNTSPVQPCRRKQAAPLLHFFWL